MGTEQTPEEAQTALRDRLVNETMFAADHVVIPNRGLLDAMPPAMTVRVVAEAVIGALLAYGLVTPASEDDWPKALQLDLPEHLVPDVAGRFRRWLETQAGRE
ncbi:MAG TPA: hypothetical protein VF657_26185 [Actinoplanes sp.]|jgi:hypothetical protein